MEYSRMTGNIEIYFSDLSENAKKIFLEAMRMKDEKEGNYDMDICPIAVVAIPSNEEDYESEDDIPKGGIPENEVKK